MKVAIDYKTQLDQDEQVLRSDLHKALEENEIETYELTSLKIKKYLEQDIKADYFLTFNLKYCKLKIRTARWIILSDKKELNKGLAKALGGFDRIIVHTGYRKLQLSNKFGIEKEKITVLYKKTDDRFNLRNITDDERDIRRILTVYRVNKPYIFFYSHLDEGSSVEFLIEGFSQIHQKFPDCKLLLASPDIKVGWDNKPIGQTKRAKEIIELVVKYKLQRKIVFAGFIEDKDLPVIIRNAEVCVNLKDYDHFPKTLVEQLFTGACIISADNAISKEILGNAGFVVSSKYVDSITQGIKHLLDEKNERDLLRQKAEKRRKLFSEEVVYKELLTALRDGAKAMSKEETLLLQFQNDGVDFEKILKINFEVNKLDISRKISIFQLRRDVGKYRLIFIQGSLPREWRLKLLLLKLSLRNVKFIGVQNSCGKNYTRLNSFLHRLVRRIVLNKRVEFDNRYDSAAEILPEFINLNKQENNEKLGNFTGIIIDSNIDEKDCLYLLKETYESKCKYLINAKLFNAIDEDDEIDAKYKRRIQQVDLVQALSSAKIFINFNPNISQQKILQAMRCSNVLICLKTPNTLNLLGNGINGYMYDKLDIKRVAAQVSVLVENKKHLKDICNINNIKAGAFEFENLKNKYRVFLAKL